MTAGAGVGGQVGAEVTDFVFILNTDAAVESFAQFGSVTLGGNCSVAAGPLGRNAEVDGSASLKNVAAVFSYSKTKGLFAGVSVEGSVLVERREANRKFYGNNCKAAHILSGQVAPPPACAPLMRILNSRAFSRVPVSEGDYYSDDDDYYNDVPSNFSTDESSRNSARRQHNGSHRSRHYTDDDYGDDNDDDYYARRGTTNSESASYSYYKRDRQRHRGAEDSASPTSWEDNIYDKYGSNSGRPDRSGYRPKSQKPDFRPPSQRKASSAADSKNKAIALYTFAAQQDGDLPFKKGDVITIVKKSETTDDWWTGKLGSKQGIFPANYVKLV